MPRRTALFVALAALPTIVTACTAGPTPSAWTGTVEDVRMICRAEQASPTGCSEACLVEAYYDAVEGPCAPEVARVSAHGEYDAFLDCGAACPVGRMCTETPFDLTDCDCTAACASARSAAFRDVWIARELCIADGTAAACR